MALQLALSQKQIRVDETVICYIESDSPTFVVVGCFYTEPPPPGYGPCDESGRGIHGAGSSQFSFTAFSTHWMGRSGTVTFTAKNEDGEQASAVLQVDGRQMNSLQQRVMMR